MSTQLTLKSAHALVEQLKPQMRLALPKHMDADRLARIALTELRQVPKLQQCSTESFMKCLMVSAQLGLEPGLLGHVYFIPYGREAQLIIGYKGMIDLARRSGQIESIEARVVHANDKCEIRLGIDSTIDHQIDIFSKDRGAPIGYYAIAKLKDGGKQFEFMTKAEVDKIKSQSKAGNSGPWVTHYDAMAKKTVIRQLFKYLPVSIEIQQAVTLDETADGGQQATVIDKEFSFYDGEVEEVPDNSQTDSQTNSQTTQSEAIMAKVGT